MRIGIVPLESKKIFFIVIISPLHSLFCVDEFVIALLDDEMPL